MTRGLDRATRPQRARDGEQAWQAPSEGRAVERQEPPPRAVAAGLAGVWAVLWLSVAGVGLLVWLSTPSQRTSAQASAGRFVSAGPPLLNDPAGALDRQRQAHPPPPPARLEQAMRAVAAAGWGEDGPSPDRAGTAMARAEAGQ